jgi:hypothetical protein
MLNRHGNIRSDANGVRDAVRNQSATEFVGVVGSDVARSPRLNGRGSRQGLAIFEEEVNG